MNKKNKSFPVVLSAAVYPGAGQLAQRRWLMGVLFLSVFTLLLGLLFFLIFKPIYSIINTLITGEHGEVVVPWLRIWIALGGAVFVYVLSILDAWWIGRGIKT